MFQDEAPVCLAAFTAAGGSSSKGEVATGMEQKHDNRGVVAEEFPKEVPRELQAQIFTRIA